MAEKITKKAIQKVTPKVTPKVAPKTESKASKTGKSAVSLDATIYSQQGAQTGTIALPTKVFGLKWNADLVHQVVVGMMANARAGTAHTKDRSEVSGGGKKPWKQKGTGRARHGSNRSPIWSGGGTTFGPRNDKDYSQKINKKTRVKALYTVLSRKYSLGSVLFVDSLVLSAIKTKDADALLAGWARVENFAQINSSKKTATLIVIPEATDTITKSFANLPGATLVKTIELNAALLMKFRHIVMVEPTVAVSLLESKMK